jgi:hypothetical protein
LAVASSYDGRTALVPPDELEPELVPELELLPVELLAPAVVVPVPDDDVVEVEPDVADPVEVAAVVEVPPLDPLAEVVVRFAEVLQAESKQAPKPIQRDRVIGGFLAAMKTSTAFSKSDGSV